MHDIDKEYNNNKKTYHVFKEVKVSFTVTVDAIDDNDAILISDERIEDLFDNADKYNDIVIDSWETVANYEN